MIGPSTSRQPMSHRKTDLAIPRRSKSAKVVLVCVLAFSHQRDRRLQENIDIEQHGPILDVGEVELDALLDLFFAVDFAAPPVDLGPAGDTRLDAMTRKITVYCLVKEP